MHGAGGEKVRTTRLGIGQNYGGPEGSFPSGNEQRCTCAAAMSGSARTGAAMGSRAAAMSGSARTGAAMAAPGRQCAETLGFEWKQAE